MIYHKHLRNNNILFNIQPEKIEKQAITGGDLIKPINEFTKKVEKIQLNEIKFNKPKARKTIKLNI
jgi:hypothetical protein